ncbi:MAG: type II secretion system protein [Phycisphaeraceae bacterium]
MPSSIANDRRQNASAFTLIEMLLVVAIIVLLLAMLLPQLHKSKREALVVICHTNSSQIASALIGFATDNQGRMPWVGPLYRNQQMGYIHYWTEYWPDTSKPMGFQNWGLLSKSKYMHHQSPMWMCPLGPQDNSHGNLSHSNAVPHGKNPVLAPGDEHLGWAHARAGYLRRLMKEPTTKRSVSIQKVGSQAFFADWFSTPQHVDVRHKDHIVVGYGDNSVRRHKVDLASTLWQNVPDTYSQSWPAAQVYYDAVWKSFE